MEHKCKHSCRKGFTKIYARIRANDEHVCAICQANRSDLTKREKRHIARKIAFSWICSNLPKKGVLPIGTNGGGDKEKKKKRELSSGSKRSEPLFTKIKIESEESPWGAFGQLPPEIFGMIISFILDPETILNFRSVSTVIYDEVWIHHNFEYIIRKTFPLIKLSEDEREKFFDEQVKIDELNQMDPKLVPLTMDTLRNFFNFMGEIHITPSSSVYEYAKIKLKKIVPIYQHAYDIYSIIVEKDITIDFGVIDAALFHSDDITKQLVERFITVYGKRETKKLYLPVWSIFDNNVVLSISWIEAALLSKNIRMYEAILETWEKFYLTFTKKTNVTAKGSLFEKIYNSADGYFNFITSILLVYDANPKFYKGVLNTLRDNGKEIGEDRVPVTLLMKFYMKTGEEIALELLKWKKGTKYRNDSYQENEEVERSKKEIEKTMHFDPILLKPVGITTYQQIETRFDNLNRILNERRII